MGGRPSDRAMRYIKRYFHTKGQVSALIYMILWLPERLGLGFTPVPMRHRLTVCMKKLLLIHPVGVRRQHF